MTRISSLYSGAAGVISAIGSALINIAFWQALIIAAITGLLTAGGAVLGAGLAARITAQQHKELNSQLKDVKGAVGAKRRREDNGIAKRREDDGGR